MTSNLDNITVVVASIDRPQAVIRLVQSIRRGYPNIPIVVGEQIKEPTASLLKGVDADVLFLPYDYGVAATRNALVSRVVTEYFVLCDDDFIFGETTDLTPALHILTRFPDIGIVGGLLFDVYNDDEMNERSPRYWENWIHINEDRRTILMMPIAYELPEYTYVCGWKFLRTDTVVNWAVMRTNLFRNGVLGWDAQFKISGEHEDFYLKRKVTAPEVSIVYCPDLVVYHNHASGHYGTDYGGLRARLDGWSTFRLKWNVDRVIEVSEASGFCIDTIQMKEYLANGTYQDFVRRLGEHQSPDLNTIGIDANGRLYCNLSCGKPKSREYDSELFLSEGSGQIYLARSAKGEHAMRLRLVAEAPSLVAEATRGELETRLEVADSQARAAEALLRQSTDSLKEVTRQNSYLKNRRVWDRLFFRMDGRPIKLLRRVLFHTNGKPRGIFRKRVLKAAAKPGTALHYWLTSPAYLALPRAERTPSDEQGVRDPI